MFFSLPLIKEQANEMVTCRVYQSSFLIYTSHVDSTLKTHCWWVLWIIFVAEELQLINSTLMNSLKICACYCADIRKSLQKFKQKKHNIGRLQRTTIFDQAQGHTLCGPIIVPVQERMKISSASSIPQLTVPSPIPFSPLSSSSRSLKLLGTAANEHSYVISRFTIHSLICLRRM